METILGKGALWGAAFDDACDADVGAGKTGGAPAEPADVDILGSIDHSEPFPWKVLRTLRDDGLHKVELKPTAMLAAEWTGLTGRRVGHEGA